MRKCAAGILLGAPLEPKGALCITRKTNRQFLTYELGAIGLPMASGLFKFSVTTAVLFHPFQTRLESVLITPRLC